MESSAKMNKTPVFLEHVLFRESQLRVSVCSSVFLQPFAVGLMCVVGVGVTGC